MEIHLQKVSRLEWTLSVIETELSVIETEGARLRAENELLYEELNRALGSHAPNAWERIAQKLTARLAH